MGCFKGSLAGPGYIILNTIRIMNIIGLVAVIAASSVMLVKTFIVSKFFFFDGVSHLITASTSLFLIISELPFFRGYYARNWPLLSISSGFVTLGSLMIVVGVGILGNLNKEATSERSLGLAFWRIVISSGVVVVVMGVVNILANYIFRDTSQGVTARMVRAHGAVAPQKVDIYRSGTSSTRRKSFHLGRSDTLPSFYSPESRQQQAVRSPMTISGPMSSNRDQFAKFSGSAEVERPDLAHHPALAGDRF